MERRKWVLYLHEILNSLTHGIGVLLSIAGLSLLVAFAIIKGSYSWKTVRFSVYGFSLIMMYTASTLYYAFSDRNTKRSLNKYSGYFRPPGSVYSINTNLYWLAFTHPAYISRISLVKCLCLLTASIPFCQGCIKVVWPLLSVYWTNLKFRSLAFTRVCSISRCSNWAEISAQKYLSISITFDLFTA